MPSLGDEFRAAREARHLSLSDVSKQIYVRSLYLQKIEDEDWGALAAPVYVRGFIRTYARFLGLDGEDAVRRYNQLVGDSGVPAPVAWSYRSSAGPSVWVWLAGIAALILVAFAGYSYYQFEAEGGAQRAEQPRAVAEASIAPTLAPAIVTEPVAPPPVGATRTPDASHTLVVRARQDSWLELSVDGQQEFSQTLPAGSEKVFHGKTVSMRVGNAGGVDVVVDGKDLGILGAPGDVVDRTFKL